VGGKGTKTEDARWAELGFVWRVGRSVGGCRSIFICSSDSASSVLLRWNAVELECARWAKGRGAGWRVRSRVVLQLRNETLRKSEDPKISRLSL